MAEGERGGRWVPPNGDDDDEQRRESGGLSSGDPLWSGSRPADEQSPQPGGWQPPTDSGWQPPPQNQAWSPPGGGGQPAGQWGAPPPSQAPYYGVKTSNGKAVGSLVCGIVGIVFCPLIFSIAAVILGYQARSEIDMSQGRQQNRGTATAGIITGWIGIAYGVLIIILFAAGVLTLDDDTSGGASEFSEPAISLLVAALPL